MEQRLVSDAEKLRSVPLLVAAAALNLVFVVYTFFGSIPVLFLDTLGLDKARIGFLLSLVPFLTIISPFIAGFVSRFSYKKFFLVFYFLRKLVIVLLLFTPLVLGRGLDAAFWWVAFVIFFFALLRAVSFTAFHPWQQTMVPDYFRGKLGGIQGVASTLVRIAAVGFAGYLVGMLSGLTPFLIVIGVGIAAGILSGFFYALVPEERTAPPVMPRKQAGEIWKPFRDRRYLLFLTCLSLAFFSIQSLNTFLPLYMREQIGISADRVIYLDLSGALAALIFCYLIGWAADRYGSKPVMRTGMGGMFLLPLAWIALPLAGDSVYLAAVIIAFLKGLFVTAWGIASTRYLYVSAVPAAQRVRYLASFMAVVGVSEGSGPLLNGYLIDSFQGLEFFSSPGALFNPYFPFFLLVFVCLIIAFLLLGRLSGEKEMPTRRFLGMFFQGHPILAFESLLRFGFEREEPERLKRAARIGLARNPLNVNDLAESLRDPSFSVRYEAVASASQMPPDPALVESLLGVMGGADPELAGDAALALGRIGDPVTILPLREMLRTGYPILRARSARALGMIGDRGSVPMLRHFLKNEKEPAVRVAFFAALGFLRDTGSVGEMIAEIEKLESEIHRQEIVLSLVRVVGEEGRYIGMLRGCHRNPDTTLSQECFRLRQRKKLSGFVVPENKRHCLEKAAALFGSGSYREGAACLADLLSGLELPGDSLPGVLLSGSRPYLEKEKPLLDHVIIVLHVLGLRRKGKSHRQKK